MIAGVRVRPVNCRILYANDTVLTWTIILADLDCIESVDFSNMPANSATHGWFWSSGR